MSDFTRNCGVCGHSSDDHAYSDGYVSPLPEPQPDPDFGPTHCHALGKRGDDCEDAICECPDFEPVSS